MACKRAPCIWGVCSCCPKTLNNTRRQRTAFPALAACNLRTGRYAPTVAYFLVKSRGRGFQTPVFLVLLHHIPPWRSRQLPRDAKARPTTKPPNCAQIQHPRDTQHDTLLLRKRLSLSKLWASKHKPLTDCCGVVCRQGLRESKENNCLSSTPADT